MSADFRQRLGRVESLVLALEELPDTAAREAARELVAALLQLHALGLRRVMDLAAEDVASRFADDALVSSLLLLHDLHPLSAAERLGRALEQMRPRFHSLGGDVQLLTATDDSVHLLLRGNRAAGPTLRAEMRELVIDVVPGVATVSFEEIWDNLAEGRVPLTLLSVEAEETP